MVRALVTSAVRLSVGHVVALAQRGGRGDVPDVVEVALRATVLSDAVEVVVGEPDRAAVLLSACLVHEREDRRPLRGAGTRSTHQVEVGDRVTRQGVDHADTTGLRRVVRHVGDGASAVAGDAPLPGLSAEEHARRPSARCVDAVGGLVPDLLTAVAAVLVEAVVVRQAHRAADARDKRVGGRVAGDRRGRGAGVLRERGTGVTGRGDERFAEQRCERVDLVRVGRRLGSTVVGLPVAEAVRDDRARVAGQDRLFGVVQVVVVVARRNSEDDLRPRRHRVGVLDVERGFEAPVRKVSRTGRGRRRPVLDHELARRRVGDAKPRVELRQVALDVLAAVGVDDDDRLAGAVEVRRKVVGLRELVRAVARGPVERQEDGAATGRRVGDRRTLHRRQVERRRRRARRAAEGRGHHDRRCERCRSDEPRACDEPQIALPE